MSKKITAGIILLIAITAIVAAIHIGNQDTLAGLVISQGDHQINVSFADMDSGSFSGELTDGKGDVTYHNYTGILLRELLVRKGIDLSRISCIRVTSADNYSVEFTAGEILQADKVYAAITADGRKIEGIDPGTDGVQIIVFGDANSRRCVRFAQKITIE